MFISAKCYFAEDLSPNNSKSNPYSLESSPQNCPALILLWKYYFDKDLSPNNYYKNN